MKLRFVKISACLGFGLMLILLSACEKPKKTDEKSFFNLSDNTPPPPGRTDVENFMDLTGLWKFSIGDDSSWASPEYDDWDWEEIKVPSSWENEGFHGYNGYAWYRMAFKLPAELDGRDLYLNLGFVDDIDQTFVNGELVGLSGGFPPYFLTAYNASRKYYIPKDFIKKGENLIAVRVYDSQLEGGLVKGKIGLYPTKDDVHILSELEIDINLTGIWKFKIGDKIVWANKEHDDSDWIDIFVPAFWETQGYQNYNGFAWYRKTFLLPEEFADHKMVLLLGKIDDIDQTYLNGKLIGSIGDWRFEDVPMHFNDNSEWETLRAYFIPDDLLLPGDENTIAVRVYDGFIDGGIYEGPIGFVAQEKFRQYWKRMREIID